MQLNSTQKREELIARLQSEIKELEKTLGYTFVFTANDVRLQLPFRDDCDPEQIVSNHIKSLHRYNEAKDATQVLFFHTSHVSKF